MKYLESKGKSPQLVYTGSQKILQGSLHEMVKKFEIPLIYLAKPEREAELLVTVDCRAGERNVSALPHWNLAVLDHHTVKEEGILPKLSEVRTESDGYASCATLLWAMPKEDEFPVESDDQLPAILYYGLYMDAQELKTSQKMDKMMLDELSGATGRLIYRLLTDYFEIPPKQVRTGEFDPGKAEEFSKNKAALYHKRKVSVGYVKATALFPEGEEILLRMLKGDARKKVTQELYIMIGMDGETYHNDERSLRKNYILLNEPFLIDSDSPWQPKIYRYADREVRMLSPYVKKCVTKDDAKIWAAQLKCRIKVLTKWGEWHLGEAEDWLVNRENDPKDIYIIKKNIFDRTYEREE